MHDNKCTYCGFECNDLLGKRCPCCLREPKTEDLSFQEACAAIGRGECIYSSKVQTIFGVKGVWTLDKEWSTSQEYFSIAPYQAPFSIVPDPSKPVEPTLSQSPYPDLNTLYTLSNKCSACQNPSVLNYCAQHIPHNLKQKGIDWIKQHVDPHFDKRSPFFGPTDEHEWNLLAMRILHEDFKSLTPPSLTYEQALECEKVRIEWPSNKYWPNKCVEVLYRDHDFKDGPSDSEARWVPHLLKLDLAECRNYKMEKVD